MREKLRKFLTPRRFSIWDISHWVSAVSTFSEWTCETVSVLHQHTVTRIKHSPECGRWKNKPKLCIIIIFLIRKLRENKHVLLVLCLLKSFIYLCKKLQRLSGLEVYKFAGGKYLAPNTYFILFYRHDLLQHGACGALKACLWCASQCTQRLMTVEALELLSRTCLTTRTHTQTHTGRGIECQKSTVCLLSTATRMKHKL